MLQFVSVNQRVHVDARFFAEGDEVLQMSLHLCWPSGLLSVGLRNTTRRWECKTPLGGERSYGSVG
jgi:hypothetical protein